MQNNPMGAMMPQGVAPAASTGLNFQSDPSMRAQFKGFMSGMQAKQPAPAAPMVPMMQQPLPMPPSMQNIDIFQPSMPMRMAMGGSVPRNTQIAGQPHMLSYITPGEAGVLRAMGGAGRPGPGGIPAFYNDPYESSGTYGTDNFSSGSSYDVATSSDDNNFSTTDPYESTGTYGTSTYTYQPPPSSDDSSSNVNFSTTTAPGGTSDGSDPVMDALSRALQNTAAENKAQRDRERADANLGARFDQIQGQSPTGVGSGPTAVGGMPETLDFSRNVIDAIDIADILGENAGAQNNLLDTVFDSDDYDRPVDQVYDPNTTVEGVIDSGPIAMPDQMKTTRDTFNDLGVFGPNKGDAPVTITGPTSRPDGLGSSRDSTIGTGMNEGQDSGAPLLSFDLGGMGTEGEAPPPPSGSPLDDVQAAIDLARGKGGDSTIIDNPEISRLSDLMNRQTTVTLAESLFDKNKKDAGNVTNIPGQVDPNTGLALDPDARTVSSLEQLGRRAGRGSEGVSGFIERFTGFNPAASMYEDIVNNNYSPIYDNRGQIIGTINPETGQLGKGSRPIDTGAISSTDSDLKAFRYNQFADRNLSGGGGGDTSSPPPVFNPPDSEDDSGEKAPPMIDPERPDTGGGTQQPVVKLPPAQVGNPLGFGYGQFNLSPTLNSAADNFMRLLGGGR